MLSDILRILGEISPTGCITAHIYGFLFDGLPEMVKLLPVANKRLRNKTFNKLQTWSVIY